MSSGLDMALDDLIGRSKRTRGGGRVAPPHLPPPHPPARRGGFRGRGIGRPAPRRGGGGPRGGFGGGGFGSLDPDRPLGVRRGRPPSFRLAKMFVRAPDNAWQRDLFNDAMEATSGSLGKLYISNLDYRVSNDDIRELFSEAGPIEQSSIHYDRSGRSKGTAEVTFLRRFDAVKAMKRYDNVHLDGKPMRIEMIGISLPPPRPFIASANRSASITMIRVRGRGRGRSFIRFRARGIVRGRGRVRGSIGRRIGAERNITTTEDLDKELENYHIGAKLS